MLLVAGVDATEMVVCGRCGQVRGPWRSDNKAWPGPYLQGCACVPGDQERWPLVKYQTIVELCHVCGAEALPSGSQWSHYQCDACKERVMALNYRSRRCVIPIGRHSLMNDGFGAGRPNGEEAPARPKSHRAGPARRAAAADWVDDFVQRTIDFLGKHDGLFTWRRQQVLANLAAADLGGRDAVPLPAYLAACAARPVDKDAAFEGLCRLYRVRRRG